MRFGWKASLPAIFVGRWRAGFVALSWLMIVVTLAVFWYSFWEPLVSWLVQCPAAGRLGVGSGSLVQLPVAVIVSHCLKLLEDKQSAALSVRLSWCQIFVAGSRFGGYCGQVLAKELV